MNHASHRRREQARRRSRRRLIAVILAVDVAGGVSLAYALTRPDSHAGRTPVHASSLVAHPQDPLTQSIAATPGSSRPLLPRHRALPPATAGVQSDRPQTGGTAGQTDGTQAMSPGAQASWRSFAAGQPGPVGLAVAPIGSGPVITLGALQIGHAWSTMKVPVLTSLLAQLERSGGRLSSSQREDATLALEVSDNTAAEALFSTLESTDGGLDGAGSVVQSTLRRAGDDRTLINTAPNSSGWTTWGQSEWTASGEVVFYRALANGCLLSPADTNYVLGLMGNVQSDQRWGAGAASYGGLPVAFKGGWGPENGGAYLVRQSAIVGSHTDGYVYSMLALPSDGSFSTGTAMLSSIAHWVARTIQPVSASAARCR